MSGGHRARKRFGQNFLHDPQVIARILRSLAPRPGDAVVEIGPGQGALTLPLLRALGTLDVVELDRDLIPPLREHCATLGELHIHQADALEFDFCTLAGTKKLRIVGNLPYNISTPLLFHLTTQLHCIEDMHFMLQKEVVERMTAAPGGKDYGRLGIMLQYYCDAEYLFTVGPGAFKPAPKVHSAIVRLTPHAAPPVPCDPALLSKVVTEAFSYRRKTLRNALKNLLDVDQIIACDIDPGARPETLTLVEFSRLAEQLSPTL
ncbi:MAG: 16S rRNA (adenine(1518)-N(6)/adenine(1519)-N(6))-dimethyltransferase RsmA [Gammaproteobacteria bacterium]|nr:16S rRNA (adenine(1518)-N(6)/adenine(1519)-N(6))-dimethyltransferase RsmA [Gammaproteobacteria bacterium]